MADVMLSPAATWVVPTTNSDPAKSLHENQVSVTKRPYFPCDTRQDKTDKSVSRELGSVMARLEESGCNNPDGSLLLRESDIEEAESLMHTKLPEGETENTETDQDDVKQTETTNDSHHVHDLIEQFQSFIRPQNDTEEEEDSISATQVHQEESDGPNRIIRGVVRAVKETVHTVVEGLEKVTQEAGHTVVEGLEKVTHTIRCVLPKGHTENDKGTGSNIHVQHPSLTGNMVGLGMNIHKVKRGHLVQTVAPGGLAHKSNIKDNDVIRKVNETDVGNWEFEKLQEFFGNQKSIVLKLEIERQKGEDENGQSLFITITVVIKLSFEGDQVVADIDVTYESYPLIYSGNTPTYHIYQEGSKTSKYLSLCGSFSGMTTKMTKNCDFQMYCYQPSIKFPMILYNKGINQPLDLGKKSRIGNDDNKELTGKKISTDNDKRFFYFRKQIRTNLFVFELITRPRLEFCGKIYKTAGLVAQNIYWTRHLFTKRFKNFEKKKKLADTA